MTASKPKFDDDGVDTCDVSLGLPGPAEKRPKDDATAAPQEVDDDDDE